MKRRSSVGLSLVELLIVLSIISLLMQLLLPAIESAHESARRLQCQNNLKQLALACSLHEQAQGVLPSGGWGWNWVGDPDRGFGEDQPGGWHYSILPYTEQSALHDLGRGQNPLEKRRQAAILCSSIRSGVNCPSLRKAGIYPTSNHGVFNAKNSDETPAGHVRSDYAMNGGKLPILFEAPGYVLDESTIPESFVEGDQADFPWPGQRFNTGVVFIRSPVKHSQISDGQSNTYLIGEKSLTRQDAKSGKSDGDNLSMYQGYDFDVIRWAGALRTTPDAEWTIPRGDESRYHAFGSAHPTGFNMAFCDGSVHLIAYGIDMTTHERLATRADGEAVTLNAVE